MNPDPWQVYALRYARHNRNASENFLGGDPHDGPMPIAYYTWAAISGGRAIVIDTGFDEASGNRRGRQTLHSPAEGLRAIGIDPAQVEDVIITHMHYDHAGNHAMFPKARYHVQDREMFFCTGRYMTHDQQRHPFDCDDVLEMVRRVYANRVVFHDGDDEIAPGLTIHRVGGHSMGLQMVRVWTRRGWVVLASDASHYYAHMETGRVFPIVYNVAETLEGYRRAYALADSRDHVIPGHDPLVLERYPAAKPELKDWVVRLD